jgi:hypothetical protein
MGQSAKDSAENGAAEVKKEAESAASKVARTARRAYHKGAAELRDSVLTAKAKQHCSGMKRRSIRRLTLARKAAW